MCGRFALLAPTAELSEQFSVHIPAELELPARYNIAPTQPVVAVRLAHEGDQRELALLHWGLIPSWSKDIKIASRLINARSETAAEKPSFRAAFKRRHCLIPASGFYEWQRLSDRKQPMYIHSADGSLLDLAGLWEYWQAPDGSAIESCTILTTTPNELMQPIHNRMPVIISQENYDDWLHSDPDVGQHLMRPYPSEGLEAYAVSTAVNNPRNESAGNIKPLEN